MNMVQLVGKQFQTLRLNPMLCIMTILITVRTFLSGNAIMLTGLCVAFLPFFSQTQNLTCLEEDVDADKEIFSRYLMSYLIMTLGMFYLKIVTMLGATFYASYAENPLLRETFLLTYICNLVFISVVVPLVYTLSTMQRFMIGIVLCLAEIGFMVFAKNALTIMGSSFVLTEQWGLYLLMAMIPLNALLFVKMDTKKSKKCLARSDTD